MLYLPAFHPPHATPFLSRVPYRARAKPRAPAAPARLIARPPVTSGAPPVDTEELSEAVDAALDSDVLVPVNDNEDEEIEDVKGVDVK